MYENHRDNFGRRSHRSEDDRQRGFDRYGPRSQGDWRGQESYRNSDDDRTDWRAYGQRPGRNDDYPSRQSRDETPLHHDHDHEHRQYGYGRGYDDNRQQRYFTGQQNSWAVPPTTGYGSSYNSPQGYGRDYREHGYGGGSYSGGGGYGRSYGGEERGFFEKAGDEIASWFGDEDAARRREADHRGRGPKDYVRSDERIRDDVNDRLTEDWQIDASDITVMVESGEVTLNGTVAVRSAKRRAEDIVEDISGVKHVQNNLRVANTTATNGDYDSNWALNQRSTAEGGTLGKDATTAKH